MTTPCEWCGARLPVRFDTDGRGDVLEHVAACQCEGARWRRGVCVDCGVRVRRKNPCKLPRKRCPEHHYAFRLEVHRRSRKRSYRKHRDEIRRRANARYMLDAEYRERVVRQSAERYRLERRFRQRRAERRREARRQRNAEIARRYGNESAVALAAEFGLAPSSIRRIVAEVRAERAVREAA